MFTLLNYLIT